MNKGLVAGIAVALVLGACGGPSAEEVVDEMESRAAYSRCATDMKNQAIEELQNQSGDGDPFPEIKRICGTPPSSD